MAATFGMDNLEILYTRIQYTRTFTAYLHVNFHMCSASAFFYLAKTTKIKVALLGSLCYFTS